MKELNMENIPRHVGIIMDGNGRWAKERGLPRTQGHSAGMKAVKEIVKHADQLGIKYLTVYAFSTENWKRPAEEIKAIFRLLVIYVQNELKELNDNNVKVNILGDWSILDDESTASIKKALKTTENNTGLCFNIALNYGGRAEITRAAALLAQQVKCGELEPEQITEDSISGLVYTAGMPDPELIIRTGSEYRLSNFLTWQSAYSELVICSCYWPDFTPEELDKAIALYQSRDRRFGGIRQ